MRWGWTGLVFSICVSCATGNANTTGEQASASESRALGSLPDFTLETLEGETFSLSDHVGQDVIVMSFWATWCKPCLAELPHLDVLYQQERDNGLVIVAVSMDEPSTQAEVGPTVARLGLNMPVVIDIDQRAVALYNRSRNAPMTVIIDKKGHVVHSAPGYNPGDEVNLAQEVRMLLAE